MFHHRRPARRRLPLCHPPRRFRVGRGRRNALRSIRNLESVRLSECGFISAVCAELFVAPCSMFLRFSRQRRARISRRGPKRLLLDEEIDQRGRYLSELPAEEQTFDLSTEAEDHCQIRGSVGVAKNWHHDVMGNHSDRAPTTQSQGGPRLTKRMALAAVPMQNVQHQKFNSTEDAFDDTEIRG